MTTKTAKINRLRLQQDFIPNFEMRSIVLIATFAMSVVGGVCAQTSARIGLDDPVAISAAAERSEHPTDGRVQATQMNTGADSKSTDAAFNRADTNHDGRLNRKEAEHFPALSQRFDLIDLNHDSFLSREEFNQAVGN